MERLQPCSKKKQTDRNIRTLAALVAESASRENSASASEQAQRAVVLTRVANAPTSYITRCTLDRQLEIVPATARNFGASVRVFDLHFKSGIVALTERMPVSSQHEPKRRTGRR
jgi:multidrug efflux system outer membrane protein